MDTETRSPIRVHQGRNVKRLREILGVKQEYLAERLDLSQPAMSRYEQKEVIEDDVLQKIAQELNVPAEVIKNFNDEATVNFISNTFNDDSMGVGAHNTCTFNPIEKIVELYNEKIALYERMLKAEQEKVEMLQKMMAESNQIKK